MTDREKRTQLQPHQAPDELEAMLERITDPLAREIFRKKIELGVVGDPYTGHERLDEDDDHEDDLEDDR